LDYPAPKINISPAEGSFQKDDSLPNHHFSGSSWLICFFVCSPFLSKDLVILLRGLTRISTKGLPEAVKREHQLLEGKMSFQNGLMFRAYKLVSGSFVALHPRKIRYLKYVRKSGTYI